jgi:hypothetical protein
MKLRRTFWQPTHQIPSIGPKTQVLGHFELFRYCMKVDPQLAELAPILHKFAKRSYVEIFRNERTGPLHWTQNSCYGAFWTISLLHKSRCKTGRTYAINTQVR